MSATQRIWHYIDTKFAILVLSICCPLMLGIAPKFKAKEFDGGRK